MKLKNRASQNSSSIQRYNQTNDGILMLMSKPPLTIKAEEGSTSRLNSSSPVSSYKKNGEGIKCKTDPIEYADDCPEGKFIPPPAFTTPAQLVPKKRGNRNTLLNSMAMQKKLHIEQKTKKIIFPSAKANSLAKNSICDKSLISCKLVPKKEGEKKIEKSAIKSATKTKTHHAAKKMHWKQLQRLSLSNGAKISTGNSKIELPSKTAKSKPETITSASFYNSQNNLPVANEADMPPFTPNMALPKSSDSSSCTKPQIIHLKAKSTSPVKSETNLSQPKQKKLQSALPQNVKSETVPSQSKQKKPQNTLLSKVKSEKNDIRRSDSKDKSHGSAREMQALYRNLEEINWARTKEFNQMLQSNDKIHSKRRPVQKIETKELKPHGNSREAKQMKLSSKKTSAMKYSIAKPKSVAKPKTTGKPKPLGKPKVVAKGKLMAKGKPISKAKATSKPKPITKSKPKNALSALVKKKLKASAKIALRKQAVHQHKYKKVLQKNTVKVPKVPSVIKLPKPKLKLKPDEPASKKQKLLHNVSESSIVPKSSKNTTSSLVHVPTETKNPDLYSYVSSSNQFEEFSMWGNLFHNTGTSLMSALQRRQELRVTLEPVANSNLWPTDCDLLDKPPEGAESYTRHSLQERMLGVITGMDQRHISSVLRDMPEEKSLSSTCPKPSKKRKYEEESVRSSIRQSECAFRYKEIVVKKHENYIQIVLVPNMYKQNCLSLEAMKELREAFMSARKDINCKAVLLNSSGSFFCSGIDLGQLLGSNKKHIAEEMAVTIRDLILTLAIFPKPVIAAVNGYAVGLGVTLLTFCDIVLSSDKATFCIPSARMGYIPEGGALLTLPQVVGSTVAIEMLLQGRRLTAEQALKYGLVSEVLWPTQLMEEVIPRIQSLVKQPLHVMEATKTMVRCHLWEKLAVQLNQEWRMLPSQWLSNVCQQNIKQHLQTGWQVD